MCTIHCSDCLSCHTHPWCHTHLPDMHAPCHTCPLAMHAPYHTHPPLPCMPPPCMPPCHAHPSATHAPHTAHPHPTCHAPACHTWILDTCLWKHYLFPTTVATVIIGLAKIGGLAPHPIWEILDPPLVTAIITSRIRNNAKHWCNWWISQCFNANFLSITRDFAVTTRWYTRVVSIAAEVTTSRVWARELSTTSG